MSTIFDAIQPINIQFHQNIKQMQQTMLENLVPCCFLVYIWCVKMIYLPFYQGQVVTDLHC
jgi:hypothetical protein